MHTTQDTLAHSTPSLPVRMGAWVYEGIILFGLVWFAGYGFGALTQSKHALQHRHGLMLFLFLVLGAYFVYFWHKGHTLPMKTWKIRVFTRAGAPLSVTRAALRYVLAYLWFLPPLLPYAFGLVSVQESLLLLVGWVAFYTLLARLLPGRQFLHDVLAGTQLLRAAPVTDKGLV